MSDTIWAAIISGIIGVSGAIIGTIIGGKMSRKTSERAIAASNQNAIDIMQNEEFNQASAKFRAAFAPAQAKLYLSKRAGECNLKEFFDTQIITHSTAIEEFRPFVSDSTVYQKAWEDYLKTIYDQDALGDAELRWWSGMVVGEGNEEILHFLDVINQKIDEILHFASQK